MKKIRQKIKISRGCKIGKTMEICRDPEVEKHRVLKSYTLPEGVLNHVDLKNV
jgi:hypothetical protein